MLEKINYHGKELLPAKCDIVFKAVFGNEESKEILRDFLTDVLSIEIPDFGAIELLNNELTKEYEEDKLSRMDIRIKTGNNEHINVEIQLFDKKNMIPRSIYYTSKLFAAQMTEGMNYNKLGRAISLIISDYILLKDEKSYYNSYRLRNVETGNELSKLMEISYLELEKLRELARNLKEDCELDELGELHGLDGLNELGELHGLDGMELSRKEMWALFLLTESGEVLDMLAEKNGTIKKAVEKLVFVSSEEKLRFEYEQRQKAIMDYYSDMDDARQEGIEIGEIRGEIIGEARGEIIGEARGEIIGEARGNLKGKKNTVVKQLTKKLGGVPRELNEKIDKASEEKVDVIAENIFEVNSIEDVEKLL